MCGIAGFVDFEPAPEVGLLARARAMADALKHRGPDAEGYWADPGAGFATGHRRLSIVELSAAGAQPMLSRSGRFVLSYNGEVYNAAELRRELQAKGYVFRGHSDTEVIVEACAEWGLRATLPRLVGMFAFALWDRQTRRLALVRDRLGIKPLYWGKFGRLLLFGSELKALRGHPGCPLEINRDALAAFVRFAYVPTPHSIYRAVFKLPPGSVLEITAGGEVKIDRYWTLDEAIERARGNPFRGSDADAEEALAATLGAAVEGRMIADVPLGAFLSGGIDSSTVVSLMQARSARPVRTFSIGFEEQQYNEAHFAKAVASHLGTDHTELYVSSDEARNVVRLLPDIYDEPFADASQIPTYLISALTRRHVTVALSGDGGDELFGGYNRYVYAASLLRSVAAVPLPFRRLAAEALRLLPPASWDRLQAALPAGMRTPNLGEKLHKVAGILRHDEDSIYLRLVSQFAQPSAIVNGATEPPSIVGSAAVRRFIPDEVGRMRYLDTLTYLPDDILTKVDRASMAVSLEARVPMIDHRVVELAWRMPAHMRLRDGKSKWLLRQVLRRFVPERLFERRKMGFGVPIGHWLRDPLREWAEDLLSPAALAADGLFKAEPIRARWRAHLDGRENCQYPLWTILMAQEWLARARAPMPSDRTSMRREYA
jgi:asparagine synthase (glutamine-hydrolysing)